MFTFVRNCQTVFQSSCTNLHSYQQRMRPSCCFKSLPAIRIARILHLIHSNRWAVISHCCFSLQYPNNKWIWTFILMLIWHLYIFFRTVSRSFAPFLIRLSPFHFKIHPHNSSIWYSSHQITRHHLHNLFPFLKFKELFSSLSWSFSYFVSLANTTS